MIDSTDLDWWLALAPTLTWKEATTYRDTAPHSYVVKDKTLPDPDFTRAVRVIRTFGQPGRFYTYTEIYLTDHDTKWWTCRGPVAIQGVINQAAATDTYGPQDAPSTATGTFTLYDRLATEYDDRYTDPDCLTENAAVRLLIARHFGAYAPTCLDVGCGTGLLLDLGTTSPALYTGVDISQGMLNALVRKHPTVNRIVPAAVEDVLDDLPPAELVTALFGAASYLHPDAIRALPGLSTDLTVLMHYADGYLPDYYTDLDVKPPEHLDASRDAAATLGGRQFTLNNFLVTVVGD